MKRMTLITALALLVTSSAFAQLQKKSDAFASDLQTVPVMANTAGLQGSQFQTYVAILNPTASAFAVTASLYDNAGTKRDAQINVAAGELKTYSNFLDDVFHATGGGAVTFQSPNAANRFVVTVDVRTGRYGTPIPVADFAGSSSRSFAGGVSVDANTRANVGCFNQSSSANAIKATILDASGKQTIGTINLNLAANGWAQLPVTSIVSNGTIQFDPSDSALCYAVVVDNSTNDGHFIQAAEYRP
jgi:hypothetical protein